MNDSLPWLTILTLTPAAGALVAWLSGGRGARPVAWLTSLLALAQVLHLAWAYDRPLGLTQFAERHTWIPLIGAEYYVGIDGLGMAMLLLTALLVPLAWTVVHPIDEKSPLWGMTNEDLRKAQAEFLVLIKAFDDTLKDPEFVADAKKSNLSIGPIPVEEIERDINAHKFTLANAYKDTRYLESMADDAGVSNPLGNAIKNIYTMALNQGRGDDFVPMLGDFVAELNGTKLGERPK